jgi:hypothetical protein
MREDHRCAGCDRRVNGNQLCADCQAKVDRGEMDDHGREIVRGRVDLLTGKECHVSWPKMPHSISHGLIGIIEPTQRYEILREVRLPNGRFKVVLALL